MGKGTREESGKSQTGLQPVQTRKFLQNFFSWQAQVNHRLDVAEGKIRRQCLRLKEAFARIRKLEQEVEELTSWDALYRLFSDKTRQDWTIYTEAGPLDGKVMTAGEDYVRIWEATGDEVFLPYAQIEAVSLPGKEGGGWS
ncbi:hypothetical protein [Gorillibacterium timonense]|uniref:hypothetical protein n=1 Tax=Gorillibacterium timonense TaxID=1689269 RepID=UPI00071E6445|nr:hypothetical protein [Gorillibacterium timonense]